MSGQFSGDLLAVYERLRELNPSPYMYYLDFGEVQIAGSSPETLLAVQGDLLVTYPIAGTRPVGSHRKEEEAYKEELLTDEKELAEHNMLVDLARNDIGRVARFGSVKVPEYLQIERFSHVQHIVSRVEGRLLSGKDPLDAFAALFPAGTVTGAPKIRAMEIIAELEESSRGPYAGIVGYFSLNGNMDSAITIRTIFSKDSRLYLQAGAGIVADSIAEREWKETQDKLGALIAALGLEPEVE
jgi:anthranilate synthase component 1